MRQDCIAILDLGSENNSALAREIRALGVYSEIYPHDITAQELRALPNIKGILLNGGENRVVDGVEIDIAGELYGLGIPVIAIDHPKAACDTMAWGDAAALKKFVFETCGCEANWNMKNFIADQIDLIRQQVGDKKVLLALSGGVDSSVVAALLLKAIGDQLVCVHVNHGLLRKGEPEQVVEVFQKQLGATLIYVDAADASWTSSKAWQIPSKSARSLAQNSSASLRRRRESWMASISCAGNHLPGYRGERDKDGQDGEIPPQCWRPPGGPAVCAGRAAKAAFKDEVRACGVELGLPADMVYRQPFPGPGWACAALGPLPGPAGGRAGIRRHSAGGICQSRASKRYGSISPSCRI